MRKEYRPCTVSPREGKTIVCTKICGHISINDVLVQEIYVADAVLHCESDHPLHGHLLSHHPRQDQKLNLFCVYYTDKTRNFSSHIRKFRRDRLQSHL